jgi:hypothetical protein
MTKYKYFKSKNYRSNVNLVVESDIVEVSDQTSDGGTTPTLQEVTEGENKNLINGNNFQGTQAGESTSPLSVTHSNMFGEQAGRTSTGDHVNLFGQEAGISQEGGQVNALGWVAAGTNTGSHVNAFGQASLYGNTGRHANAFGEEGGNFNNFKNVNLFGFQAEADQDNQTVFSKWVSGVTKFLSRLSYNNITADRKYELLDESGDLPISTSKNANFTAVNSVLYTSIATLTVTDPTPVEGQGYVVFVRNGTTTIDGVGYTSGNLIYRFYQGGAWSSTVFGVSAPISTATQTALDAREELVAYSTTSVTVASTTTQTVVAAMLISANKLKTLNFLNMVFLGRKSNLVNVSCEVYLNDTPNLSGTPLILATFITGSSRILNFERHAILKSNILDMRSARNLTLITNIAANTLVGGDNDSTVAYDVATTKYIVVAYTNSDTTITSVFEGAKITANIIT